MKREDEKLKFGTVLRNIRENRELSVRAMSRLCECSAVYISDLENNNRKVTMNVINNISSKMLLSDEEKNQMMQAYSHDRLQIPVELLYYLIDNNLLESIKILKEYDKDGTSIKQMAKKIKDNNKRI